MVKVDIFQKDPKGEDLRRANSCNMDSDAIPQERGKMIHYQMSGTSLNVRTTGEDPIGTAGEG